MPLLASACGEGCLDAKSRRPSARKLGSRSPALLTAVEGCGSNRLDLSAHETWGFGAARSDGKAVQMQCRIVGTVPGACIRAMGHALVFRSWDPKATSLRSPRRQTH